MATGLFDTLIRAVQKSPISVLNLRRQDWDDLNSARRGLSNFTLIRPHATFEGLKKSSLILMFPELRDGNLYLGILRSKQSIATLDSRIGIASNVRLKPGRSGHLADMLDSKSSKQSFLSRIKPGITVAKLTPTISTDIIQALWREEENRRGLNFLGRALGPRTFRDAFALQQEAIETALKFFGHQTPTLSHAIIPSVSETGLGSSRLLEDTIVEHDARSIPGMTLVRSDITGFAEFEGGGDRLRVYTANKRPLEALLGVDLLYLNLNIQNLVLVQYKMLERSDGSTGADWIYRPDAQLDEEIKRMDAFRRPTRNTRTSYRLNSEAFYMRFVKRDASVDSPAITMPIDHFKTIRAHAPKGPRGGLRISYEALNGQYMREAGLVDLVRAGYIGCDSKTSAAFEALIDSILRDGNAAVVAIQSKIK